MLLDLLHTMWIVDNYIQNTPVLTASARSGEQLRDMYYVFANLPPSGVTRCMRCVGTHGGREGLSVIAMKSCGPRP